MKQSSKEPTISIRDIKQRISTGDLEAERLMGLILLDGTGVKKNVNEGFRLLRESAERGDSTSECDVGFCFHTGQGTNFNCSEAIRYYQLSANHSNAKGHNNLGYCLFNGEGTRADQVQAAMHFKISSENNCPEGICNYARCLEYGDGVPQDLRKAAELYKKSADLNNSHAMYCYGRCLANGIGVPKDDQKAVEYFKRSADKHDEYGQLYYNLMLFKGRGIQRDENAAVNFFQREALAGNPHAQTYYGIALETGRGVPNVDINKATMQYRMAANNGDPHGQFCLANLFREGKGVQKNEVEAARLYKQAADNGYGRSMVIFGNCLNEGIGVTQFKPGAVSYYKAAAEKGKAVGQFKYGEFIEEGKFVEKNLSLAAHFYKLSSDQHYAEAEFALGSLHEFGKGVKIDIDSAASLYKRAADQRLDRAEDRYGKCLQRGRGVQKSPIMAVDFFRRSASQKFAAGQFHLGRSFETGLGVPSGPDLSVAINNYKLAAAQNHQQALYHLGLLYKNGVKMNPNTKACEVTNYGKSLHKSVKYPPESIEKFMNFINKKTTPTNNNDENDKGGRVILEKNEVEACKLFRTAALQGHTKSLYEYGICLLFGVGIQQDIEDAKNQFKLAASIDHVESMFTLALISKEIDKNEETAIKWLREASSNGHSIAQCELAKLFYFKGITSSSDQNDTEMIELFTKSAKSGYADAQFWLGRLIEEGKSVICESETKTDDSQISPVISPSSRLPVEKKAFLCFSLASQQLHPFATTRVALYLLNGLGTEANSTAALEKFENAAKLGDSHAYYYLGRCHEFCDTNNSDQQQQQQHSNSLASNATIPATKSTVNVQQNVEKPTPMKSITKVKSTVNVTMTPSQARTGTRNPRMNHIAQQGTTSNPSPNPNSNSNSNSRSSSSTSNNRPCASSTQLPPMKNWITYYEKAAEAKDPSGLFALGLLYARGVISITSDSSSAMERAAALFAESAALGSACGKMCYSCCIARGEGGIEKDMELADQIASESKEKGIRWSKFGKSFYEFEDEDSFTKFLNERKNSNASLKSKDINLKVNLASSLLNDPDKKSEALTSLEEAAKKGHQGAMFLLSTDEKYIGNQQGEKFLIEAAPWIEKAVKAPQPEKKKQKPSLKKIQMTKKSITSHHKAMIQKPDGKHTYILV